LKLLRRTGDSRSAPGLNPAGMVRQGSREIGSRAGDIALYLAPAPAPESAATRRSVRTGFSGEPPEPAGRSPELGFGESAIGAKVWRGLGSEEDGTGQTGEEEEREGEVVVLEEMVRGAVWGKWPRPVARAGWGGRPRLVLT
jgi:hypothetical protein